VRRKSDDVASEGIARCITDDQPLDSAEEDKEAKIPESTNDEQTAVESSSVAGSDTAARGDEGNGSSVGGGEGAGCAETSTAANSLDGPPDTSHDKKETTTTDNASVENVASDAEEGAKKFSFPTQEEFYDQWRRFNIDLAPKVRDLSSRDVDLFLCVYSSAVPLLKPQSNDRIATDTIKCLPLQTIQSIVQHCGVLLPLKLFLFRRKTTISIYVVDVNAKAYILTQ